MSRKEPWEPPGEPFDLDKEPWSGRIEYGGPFAYFIHITHGVFRYGPDGGPFMALTYKGAKRKMERELRLAKRRQAMKLGYREMQESALEAFDREMKGLER